MINSVMTFACDECDGHGVIFWGNDLDYDVEPCNCALTPNHNHYNPNE
jgi:hypothetical protein